jgi:hypothetical protein
MRSATAIAGKTLSNPASPPVIKNFLLERVIDTSNKQCSVAVSGHGFRFKLIIHTKGRFNYSYNNY